MNNKNSFISLIVVSMIFSLIFPAAAVIRDTGSYPILKSEDAAWN